MSLHLSPARSLHLSAIRAGVIASLATLGGCVLPPTSQTLADVGISRPEDEWVESEPDGALQPGWRPPIDDDIPDLTETATFAMG